MNLQFMTVFLWLFGVLSSTIYSQTPFLFQGEYVSPGTKQHFKIEISDGIHSTSIPVTVFCGVKDGPTLGVTAGIHGYEYPPILAGQQLIKSIDPNLLKGIVILVQIANMASFSKRSPFVNPLDDKNLNRQFPGDTNGSISQKIAAFITNNVIAKSTYFVDMHSGDASEDLLSYAAYYTNDSMSKVSKKAKKMAEALLFKHIVGFDTNGKKYVEKELPSLYCSAEAFKRSIPSVDIECGKLGLSSKSLVFQIEKGMLNLLKHLAMVPGEEETREKKPLFINKRTFQESKFDGIFYPEKQSGDYVEKGTQIGVITDYFGKQLDTIYAKSNGVILLIIGTPPVNKGETIVVIGQVN